MRDVLTPEEIAALTTAFAGDAPAPTPEPAAGVRPLDLTNQERPLEGRLPGLELVLGRFARGSTATPGGSGLGLALVAQQAALHGGTIVLSDSPLGGLRATLTVSASDESPSDGDHQA